MEDGKTKNTTDADKPYKKKDLKYTLERLYKCRDLEITNLWQRSVFLSVFMLLCFSGYGYLIDKMVTVDDATYYGLAVKDNNNNSLDKESIYFIKNNMSEISKPKINGSDVYINNLKLKESVRLEIKNYNLAAIGIAMIGIVFSILWISMAKGSKAWYEVYENAIGNFEDEYHKELGIPQMYVMGNMFLSKGNKDNNLFSSSSGAFSPSKINIAIGQTSLIIWMSLAIVHIFYNIKYIFEIEFIPFGLGKVLSCIIPIILLIILKCIICKLLKHVESSFLNIHSLVEKNKNSEDEKNKPSENKRNLILRIFLCKP